MILHRVVVDAPLATDREDRHDIGMMQLGCGLGLGLEPTQLVGIQRRGERQYLQRHLAVERDLLGLVDDPHAAPADLAEDAEVAQHWHRCTILHPFDSGPGAGFALDPAGQPEDLQAGPQLVGDRRVLGGQAIQIDRPTAFHRGEIGLERPGELAIGRRLEVAPVPRLEVLLAHVTSASI